MAGLKGQQIGTLHDAWPVHDNLSEMAFDVITRMRPNFMRKFV